MFMLYLPYRDIGDKIGLKKMLILGIGISLSMAVWVQP
jgi:hypothetical protein